LWAVVVERNPDAGFQRVDDRLLVAGPDDFLHTFEDECGELSHVAERIFELCDGTRTIAQIADILCGEFEVDPDQCCSDTVDFIRLLVDRHLLVLR
jgi:pyrroloquinoline quinone biosynthesis protein D